MIGAMAEQNYANHPRYVPLFHFVVLPVLLLTLIGSIVNLTQSLGDHERLYSAALIVALSFAGFLTAFFGRVFALKAQDRAIRAEENLRHFAMTGKVAGPAPRSAANRSAAFCVRRRIRCAGAESRAERYEACRH